MPLLMVLDQEIGMGYGNQQPIASDDFSLLEGVDLPINEDKKPVNWSTLSLVSLKLYEQALSEGTNTVSLNTQDLSPYTPAAGDTQPKVEGFYVMGSFLTDSVQNMDKDKFQFVHQATGGPSAFDLMSRFCNDNHILTGQVTQAISWEEFSDQECIFAEINHIPNLKSGNVLIRPNLRKYEIPYLSTGSVKQENQISPSDLCVSAKEDGEIILRSKRLGKRVYPRLTNAHNYENGLPVYRFLCDLARQGSEELFNWNWGFLSDRPFLPRVEYKHLIVSKATWNLKASKLQSFSSVSDWQAFRLKSKMPRYVQLAESDNLLLLDMESEFDVKILKETLAKNGKIRLIEYLETLGKGLLQSDSQHFANEVIIPFLAKPFKKIYKPVLVTQGFIKERREFLPGSEWLYLKIQCAPKIANHLLVNLIRPLCKNLFKNNIIEKWFFVRYQDPENQIRLRFYNSYQPTFFMKILYEINLRIQPYIQNGGVINVSVDTYERELERYQHVNYDLLESIFSAESTAILNVLSMDFKPQRWQIALRGVDLFLEDLGYTLVQKKEFAHTLANGFYNEFKADQSFLVQLNNKYRQIRSDIEFIMDPDNDETSGLSQVMSYFSQRSELLCQIRPNEFLNESSRDHLAASLIHMCLNRLFNSSHRLQELIVYHYLKKYYDSMHSSGKMSKKFEKKAGSNLQVTDNSLI